MSGASLRSFGVIIAFVLPGFICTWAISLHSPLVSQWFSGSESAQASIGGMLFSTILALGCGLIASTMRWLIVDSIHHWTGVSKQLWDYRKLQANLAAYQLLEESHYRFYQFYGNSLCALSFAYLSWKIAYFAWPGWPDLAMLVLSIILFLGSRDTLNKYYVRVNYLLNSMED